MDKLTKELKFLLEKNTAELNEIIQSALTKHKSEEIMERVACYQKNVLINFLLYINAVMGKGSASAFLPIFIESIKIKLEDI